MNLRTTFSTWAFLILTAIAGSALAQQITIADPGLDAAIRDALSKPVGTLTQTDLLQPRWLPDAFQFGINGPPGIYTIFASNNLVTWTALGTTTNTLGSVSFTIRTLRPFT